MTVSALQDLKFFRPAPESSSAITDEVDFDPLCIDPLKADKSDPTVSKRRSLCRHATSHGPYVFGFGTAASNVHGTGQKAEQQQRLQPIKWKACLNSNVVWLTCSPRSGSLIVAATNDGNVSLIRGSDGRVLVRRKLHLHEGSSSSSSDNDRDCDDDLFLLDEPPLMAWISGAPDGSETLLVESRGDVDAKSSSDHPASHFILLTNIDGIAEGDTDNSQATTPAEGASDATVAAEEKTSPASGAPEPQPSCPPHAARSNMQMSNFVLPRHDVRAIGGCYYEGQSMIRLLVCTGDGTGAVFDYRLTEGTRAADGQMNDDRRNDGDQVRLVRDSICLDPSESNCNEPNGASSSNSSPWVVDCDLGINAVTLPDTGRTYFMLSAFSEETTVLYWLDLNILQVTSRFRLDPDEIVVNTDIENPSFGNSKADSTTVPRTTRSLSASRQRRRRPKILAAEPIPSCSPDTLAIALAVSSPTSSGYRPGRILILQLVAEEMLGLSVLCSEPLLLYSVPLSPDGGLRFVELAACPNDETPYSFCLKLWGDDGHNNSNHMGISYRSFRPSSGRGVGDIMRLLALKDFAQIEERLASKQFDPECDGCACFSPLLVDVRRLQSVLQQGQLSNVALEQAEDCFRRLAEGAIADQEGRGLQHMMDACDMTLRSLREPRPSRLSMVLSSLVSMLQRVETGLAEGPRKNQIRTLMQSLQDRLAAIDFLAGTVLSGFQDIRSEEDQQLSTICLEEPFYSIQSPAHLFALLIDQGYFAIAENLWRLPSTQLPSPLQQWLTPDTVTRSILKIGPGVEPSRYSGFLGEVVIPNLSLGHELLVAIQSWACQTADALEDRADCNGCGLDSAIHLLEVSTSSSHS